MQNIDFFYFSSIHTTPNATTTKPQVHENLFQFNAPSPYMEAEGGSLYYRDVSSIIDLEVFNNITRRNSNNSDYQSRRVFAATWVLPEVSLLL